LNRTLKLSFEFKIFQKREKVFTEALSELKAVENYADIDTKIFEQLTKLQTFKLPPYKLICFDKKYDLNSVSSELYKYIDQAYIQVKIEADGNCLFRAISLALYGNQKWHVEIRYRTTIELF
jgi:hypothetical protein